MGRIRPGNDFYLETKGYRAVAHLDHIYFVLAKVWYYSDQLFLGEKFDFVRIHRGLLGYLTNDVGSRALL